MACLAKKTIGVSDCKSLLQYLKGFAVTAKTFSVSEADAKDGTKWQASIANGDITLFPTWAFNYENISSDPVLEESIMSAVEVDPGNYRLKFTFITDIKQHNAMYSWNDSGGRVFLIDTANEIWGTTQDDGLNLKGLLLDRVHVEKLMLNDGSAVAKTVVNLYFIDNTELDLRGVNASGASFVNGLTPLSGAVLAISGTPNSTTVIFTAKTANNNNVVDIAGFVAGDIVMKTTAGVAQTISGLVESTVTPGLYTASGTGLASGTIELKKPTLIGPYKTDKPTSFTI